MARGKKPQDAAMEAMAVEVMERTARSLMRMSGTNPKLEGCVSCTKHNTLDFMGGDQRKVWFQLVDALKTGADGDYQQCAKTCQSISSLSDVHDFTRAHAMIVLYELAKMFDYPRAHFARQALDSVKRLEEDGNLTQEKIWKLIGETRKAVWESEGENAGCGKGEAKSVMLEAVQQG